MSGLKPALEQWSVQLRGGNRAKAIEIMEAMAKVLMDLDRDNRFCSIEPGSGVLCDSQNGNIGHYQVRNNHSVK